MLESCLISCLQMWIDRGDKMLDPKDIELLKNMMKSLESSVLNKIDEKLTESENLILEETGMYKKNLG